MALVQIGESLTFLCMGRDTAEFTVEQQKAGKKSLVCTNKVQNGKQASQHGKEKQPRDLGGEGREIESLIVRA